MQFTLSWNNSDLLGNPNNINQRAFYRRKSIGGVFNEDFVVSNPLALSVTSVVSPVLLPNVIYEFKVESVCTVGGSLINGNGIVESLGFGCIVPVEEHGYNYSEISISVSDTDLTKAKFTLKKSSDNSIIGTPITVIKSQGVNVLEATVNNLLSSTTYYWEIILYAMVGGIEKFSNTCGPHTFTTDIYITPTCGAVTSLVVAKK